MATQSGGRFYFAIAAAHRLLSCCFCWLVVVVTFIMQPDELFIHNEAVNNSAPWPLNQMMMMMIENKHNGEGVFGRKELVKLFRNVWRRR